MIFYAHSGLRYLVLLAGVATVVYAAYGILARRPYDRNMRVLAGLFAGFMHLNVLLGLGVIFTNQFYPQLAGHVVMMVFAAAVGQIVPSVMRRRPEEERTYVPHLVGALLALALIYGGVVAIDRQLVPGVL